jgi:hypothetical protein
MYLRHVAVPTAPIVALSLVAGYSVAAATEVRALGAVVLIGGGVLAGREWLKRTGGATTAVLTAVYLGSFVASHAIAKVTGAWPAVLTAAAVAAAAAWFGCDRTAAARATTA